MDLKKRNIITNEFLLIMKQALDAQPRIPYFDFKFSGTDECQGKTISANKEGLYLTQLKAKTGVIDDEFKVILNYCYSQKYIIGTQQYLRITYKGMDRANDVENRLIEMTPSDTLKGDIKNKFNSTEKKILEKFFGMETGYVLNFSNRTFAEFFTDNYNVAIYDDKYDYGSGSKANRLRAFWDKESKDLVSNSIIKMIEWWETDNLLNNKKLTENEKELANKCIDIAKRLKHKQPKDHDENNLNQDENNFLSKDYNSINIKDIVVSTNMITIIEQRLIEIEKCINNDIPLGAIFLIGSTFEGILIDLAKQHPADFNKANSAPKDLDGNIKKFSEWTLNSLIDVASELKFIGLDVKKHSHSLRDFRNYIHPEEQLRQNFNPDKQTALIAYQVLKAAIDDISKKTNENILQLEYC